MGSLYYFNTGLAASEATLDDAVFQIWNPSSTKHIALVGLIALVRQSSGTEGNRWRVRRSTARGTPAATTTITAAHDLRGKAAPDSGFEIDEAVFSVEPTLAGGNLYPAWVSRINQSSGLMLPIPRGIEIPPGTGLAFVNGAAIIHPQLELGLLVEER